MTVRFLDGDHNWEAYDDNSGIASRRLAEEDAISGSRQLAASIHSLFWKWEWKHGFQPGAAEILLPAGFMPK
jgi:hypothetical protein